MDTYEIWRVQSSTVVPWAGRRHLPLWVNNSDHMLDTINMYICCAAFAQASIRLVESGPFSATKSNSCAFQPGLILKRLDSGNNSIESSNSLTRQYAGALTMSLQHVEAPPGCQRAGCALCTVPDGIEVRFGELLHISPTYCEYWRSRTSSGHSALTRGSATS